MRWLDPRLHYGADRPPPVVERAKGPTEVGRWEIPVQIDRTSDPLRGTITWIPAGTVVRADGNDTTFVLPWALGGVAVGLGAAMVLAVLGARRRQGSVPEHSR